MWPTDVASRIDGGIDRPGGVGKIARLNGESASIGYLCGRRRYLSDMTCNQRTLSAPSSVPAGASTTEYVVWNSGEPIAC